MKKFFLITLLGIAGFAITAVLGGGVFALLSIKNVAVVANCVFFVFLALLFFYLIGLMICDAITDWMALVQYKRQMKLRNLGKIEAKDEAED